MINNWMFWPMGYRKGGEVPEMKVTQVEKTNTFKNIIFEMITFIDNDPFLKITQAWTMGEHCFQLVGQ